MIYFAALPPESIQELAPDHDHDASMDLFSDTSLDHVEENISGADEQESVASGDDNDDSLIDDETDEDVRVSGSSLEAPRSKIH